MPPTLVELRPNRHLLDPQFDGYKLNLQNLPQYTHDLVSPVDRVFPDELQYSFVHAKLFALHNHLVFDRWDHNYGYYYIDEKQQVRRVTFDSTTNTFQNTVAYDVPVHEKRKSGHFNICLSLPSDSLAVVSDGTGFIFIVGTGSRQKATRTEWQTLHSSRLLGEGKYFIILDTRVIHKDNVELLHCLLQSVEQNEEHFISVLTWVSFENNAGIWTLSSTRELQGKGIVHYAALETDCSALYIASDNPFKFVSDSNKAIGEPVTEEPRKIFYTWLQTTEDITISLKLQENFDKKLLHVNVTPLTIKVSYGGNVFVEGKLTNAVSSELTTWNVEENGKVDILVTKAESMIWVEFLEGGDRKGEQIMDASSVEDVHRRLAHLCSETEVIADDQSVPGFSTQELEECDAASEEDTVLARLEATKHQTTHRVPLSVHQYLFHIQLDNHEVPALALRHDVDACIWQPLVQPVNSETWPLQHLGTLKAFGYIQSSKQNRKFQTCPPNFSYSVVCEATRHLFVYRDSTNTDSQLRKRTAGVSNTVKVGQQHVINIEKYGEVLGINASNDYLFLLTQKTLVVLQVC